MKWSEISVATGDSAVEAVSNILIEEGASGVAIEDLADVINHPEGGFGEIWDLDQAGYLTEGVLVKAYFPETIALSKTLPNIENRINELADFGLDLGLNEIKTSEVEQSSWETAWKKYYYPVKLSRFLTIVPSWEDYTSQNKDERIIRLDPGMAFGTGTHPTTRLTLQLLEMYLHGGERVLDVGTGSGVLSIASKALGADSVAAFDLDDVAVRSAKENIMLNEVATDVVVSANDLLKGIEDEADLVVANILAEIIMHLIDDAWRVLKPNGIFLTSGIIKDKKQQIIDALELKGFVIEQVHQMGDWIGIAARKHMED